jgi:3-hydroxyisobutyrate dehydrogenase-like beta-hydroxyacid dehydrogenase
MSKKIGIVGLGRCGMPAARRFIEKGYTVAGYARRSEVIKKFVSIGGNHLDNPRQVAKNSDTTIVMVLDDDQVKEVVTGNHGILQGAAEGTSVICMSTINRANLEGVASQCAQHGVRFLDCPFTGGPARIDAGTLTLIAAGEETVLHELRPILGVLGQIHVVGDQPGMGQAVKHCNQLLVTVIHAATVEVITLARKSGVDVTQACEIIGSGIAGNDYFRLVSKAIIEKTDSPGGMGQLWKDVNIVVNSGRKYNLPLLAATAASQYFNMAMSIGLGNEDSARLSEVMRRMTEREAG